MKCPFCNEIMSEGFIYSVREDIRWTPKDENAGVIVNHPKDNEILLAKLNYLKGCKIPVYRCSTCEIQLIIENECNTN